MIVVVWRDSMSGSMQGIRLKYDRLGDHLVEIDQKYMSV